MKELDLSILKVPPQNLEAEQSVLGGILLENVAINPVLELMAGSDFYSDAHRKIFAAVLELSERNQPIDLITLSNHLRDKKQLDAVGGSRVPLPARGQCPLGGQHQPLRPDRQGKIRSCET